MGGLVSDASISASHPKIVNNRNNIYIVYREDDTGRLWVKKYNSLLDSWDALGSAVTEYSSEYLILILSMAEECLLSIMTIFLIILL